MRKADSLGGHAFALVGFNRVGFVVQNSWGLRWGNCGFGVMPYEEWVKYGTDAWIAALGVPSSAAKTSQRAGSAAEEKTVIARAGAITFTSSAAKPPPPKVRKEVTPWSAEEAYRHTIVMGNDGAVINRILTHENGASCVRDVVCDAPLRFWQGGRSRGASSIYAHGGLNSEDASVERIQTLAPYFKANGVYPVFLTWRTGPTETLSAHSRRRAEEGAASRRRHRRPVRARQGNGRRSARSHRRSARAARCEADLEPDEAERCEPQRRPSRGCTLLADTLAQLKQQAPQLEIHLVGHSAGSIILGHLLDLLPARNLSVASCHLYAPACTVRFALDHYAPAIENKVLPRKRFHIHLLSDAVEICDTVGPYRKSLLYLVSRALESCHKMPILGLEQVFDAKANPKWHDAELDSVKRWQKFWSAGGNGLDVVSGKQVSTGTLGRRIRACHGSFDNDATTIETTLKRITGAKPRSTWSGSTTERRVADHAAARRCAAASGVHQVFQMRQRLAEGEEQVHPLQLAAEHVRQQLGRGLRLAAALLDLRELLLVMRRQIVDALVQAVERHAVRRQHQRVGRQRTQSLQRIEIRAQRIRIADVEAVADVGRNRRQHLVAADQHARGCVRQAQMTLRVTVGLQRHPFPAAPTHRVAVGDVTLDLRQAAGHARRSARA